MMFPAYPGGNPTADESHESAPERGMSLIEALVSLLILTVVFMAIAQMIGIGVLVNRASSDITRVTALAESRLEQLRVMDYATLPIGGSIGANSAGFFDTLDVDGDGVDDYTRRWLVTDSGTSKMIQVRVLSLLPVIGPAKEATIALMVAQQ